MFLVATAMPLHAQQTNAEKIAHSINKGIAIYNSLTNPALLSAISTFTDSTGVRVYPKAHINDTSLAATVFNQLNDLKAPDKQAPYIEVIVVFTPPAAYNVSHQFQVQLQLQPSPDLQIAADTLTAILAQANGLLSGSIQPENYASINTALITALNRLKNTLKNSSFDIFRLIVDIIDYLTDSVTYEMDIVTENINNSTDSLNTIAYIENEPVENLFPDTLVATEDIYVNTNYPDEDNGLRIITQQEIQNIPSLQYKLYIQKTERLIILQELIDYLNFFYSDLFYFKTPANLPNLANEILQSALIAGIDIAQIMQAGGNQQQVENYIINFIQNKIYNEYHGNN